MVPKSALNRCTQIRTKLPLIFLISTLIFNLLICTPRKRWLFHGKSHGIFAKKVRDPNPKNPLDFQISRDFQKSQKNTENQKKKLKNRKIKKNWGIRDFPGFGFRDFREKIGIPKKHFF